MILKTQSNIIRKSERRFASKMNKYLIDLSKKIIKRIKREEKNQNRSIDNDISDIITGRALEVKIWTDQDIKALYTLGPRYINKATKGKIDLDIVNLKAIKYLQSVKTFDPKFMTGSINKTTVTKVNKIIADIAFEGGTYTQMAEEIEKQRIAGVFSKKRAELIAINTVGHAYEQGRKSAIDDLKRQGIRSDKYWSTVGDDRVTEECRRNESMGWIGYEENRPSGDSEAPRDSHVRCRCTTNYKII